MGHHAFSYLIVPHDGDAVAAGINMKALEYNIPLLRASENLNLPVSGLYLQSLKLSEDGGYLVARLSEQNGARGILSGIGSFTVMDMLETPQETTDSYAFKPFEIVTIGFQIKNTEGSTDLNNFIAPI